MRIAQILYNKAHWIFEAEEMPDFPPTPEGEPIVLVDITSKPEVQEGWDYDSETEEFTEPPYVEPTLPEPTEMEILGQQLTDLEILILMGGV